ncbi:hypothetical protein Peur_028973 [Populus x canadensis]
MEQSGPPRAYSLKTNNLHRNPLPRVIQAAPLSLRVRCSESTENVSSTETETRRTQRLEAVWSIESYRNKEDANQVLLELAILDSNIVLSVYQRDLRETSRWWRRVGLATKLHFARERLIESFDWAVGVAFEPQCSDCRKSVAKMFSFVTIIDDIYDVYGTLDELELFTDAAERRDVHSINDLPDYMKLCFLARCNTTNEIAYENLKEKEENILPYLNKSGMWDDAFLQEAKRLYDKATPTFDEYFGNAWKSSSGPLQPVFASFAVSSFSLTTQKLYRNPLTRILHGTPNDYAGRMCSNKDILSLYEAPFLALEGENLLEEAKALTRWNLEDLNSRNLVKQANHAWQLPLHRSTDRLTAGWSIEAHRKRGDANKILLEFSFLDCTMVRYLSYDKQNGFAISPHRHLRTISKMHEDHPQGLFYWFVIMFYRVKTPNDELENLEIHQGLVSLSLGFSLALVLSFIFSEMGASPLADIQRGETANSVCYMNRTGLSEELALEHVRNLIDENRKKLNKERLDDSL